jgi:GNAT superfamily N-acetyltransferase
MTSFNPATPLGYSDVPPGHVASVVTCLEMRAKPDAPAVRLPEGVTIVPMNRTDLNAYRVLFRKIGADWLWYSRLIMTDAELAMTLSDPGVEAFVIRDENDNIGLLVLDFRKPGSCELVFLGLVAGATGKGLGRALMSFAIERAWSRPIERLWVHTCTFDSPAALPFYVRSGFTPFAFKVEVQPDPRLTGHLALGAAPQVPMISANQ